MQSELPVADGRHFSDHRGDDLGVNDLSQSSEEDHHQIHDLQHESDDCVSNGQPVVVLELTVYVLISGWVPSSPG